MALILPNSAFIHIPRTGGTWTRSAIKATKLKCNESGSPKDYGIKTIHHNLQQAQSYIGNKFTFSLVRNPLTYLQSRWATRSFPMIYEQKRARGEEYYDLSQSKSFIEFIEAYLRLTPGGVTRIFRRFLVDKDGKFPAVDFVGKNENLPDDLIKALNMAGEQFDEDTIRGVTPKHVKSRDKKWLKHCNYTSKLEGKIMESEKLIFDLFEYNEKYKEYVKMQIKHSAKDKKYQESQFVTINDLFGEIPRDCKILDVGCGDGVGMEEFHRMGFKEVVGIDVNPHKIEEAKGKGLNADLGDMHKLKFQDNEFDAIYSCHSFEHSFDPVKAISEFKRVTKEEGVVFIVIPFPDNGRADVHTSPSTIGTRGVNDGGKRLEKWITQQGLRVIDKRFETGRQPEVWLKLKI